MPQSLFNRQNDLMVSENIAGRELTSVTAGNGHWSSFLSTGSLSLMRKAAVLTALFGLGDATVGRGISETLGGVVSSVGNDPEAIRLGKALTGPYQGDGRGGTAAVFVRYPGEDGDVTEFRGSLTALGGGKLVGTAHQFYDLVMSGTLPSNGDLVDNSGAASIWVSYSPNYLYPEPLKRVSRLTLYPGYTGPESREQFLDLSLLFLEQTPETGPVDPSQQMRIADSRPPAYADVILAGFGIPGVLSQGYLPPDGNARAGRSLVLQGPESPGHNVIMVMPPGDSDPGNPGLRASPGASGGFVSYGGALFGIIGGGSLDFNNPFTRVVDVTGQDARDFIGQTHYQQPNPPTPETPETPEPSTLALLVLGVSGLLAARTRHFLAVAINCQRSRW